MRKSGEILISELSVEELRKAGVDDATLLNRDYVRRGNSIEGADCIDAEFFGLSRREAEITDPQQRVFLECAWEALEHAGYTGDGERVGVFAGAGLVWLPNQRHARMVARSNPRYLAANVSEPHADAVKRT